MEASHKTHRPHIKVGKDEEEEDYVTIAWVTMWIAHERLCCRGIMSIFIIMCTTYKTGSLPLYPSLSLSHKSDVSIIINVATDLYSFSSELSSSLLAEDTHSFRYCHLMLRLLQYL